MSKANVMDGLKVNSFTPTVLLIGNGSSTNKFAFGDIIDQFDEVVRFNDYEDREQDEAAFGSRCTVGVLGDHMPVSCRPKTNQTLIRVIRPADSREFYADSVFDRTVEGIKNPSSGVVVANKFTDMNMTVYTLGMDAYAPSTELTERGHDPASERLFWANNERCRRLEAWL